MDLDSAGSIRGRRARACTRDSTGCARARVRPGSTAWTAPGGQYARRFVRSESAPSDDRAGHGQIGESC